MLRNGRRRGGAANSCVCQPGRLNKFNQSVSLFGAGDKSSLISAKNHQLKCLDIQTYIYKSIVGCVYTQNTQFVLLYVCRYIGCINRYILFQVQNSNNSPKMLSVIVCGGERERQGYITNVLPLLQCAPTCPSVRSITPPCLHTSWLSACCFLLANFDGVASSARGIAFSMLVLAYFKYCLFIVCMYYVCVCIYFCVYVWQCVYTRGGSLRSSCCGCGSGEHFKPPLLQSFAR